MLTSAVYDEKAKELVLRLKVNPPTPSKSGTTLVVASTHGNQATSIIVDGKPVFVGVNAYIKPDKS